MKRILKNHILLLVVYIGGCIVASAGIFIFFTTMNSNINRVSEIKERLASYQKNKKAFEDEAKKLRVLQERLSVLEQHIITNDSFPVLLSSLENLAAKNGVSFEITSVQTPVEKGKSKLLIDATTKGSYLALRAFFAQLEKQPFEVTFRKIYLFSESDQGETATNAASGTLLGSNVVKQISPKELGWQAVITVEILSF